MDSIGSFLLNNVKHRVFVNFDIRYGEYFPEYDKYSVRPLIFNKSMYIMNKYKNIFADELTKWVIDEAGFNQSQCQMYVY